MATVHVGPVWNLQDCLRSWVPITDMSQNFYPGNLRSGQLRDLPIISLSGNMKMLPVSHKPTETSSLRTVSARLLHNALTLSFYLGLFRSWCSFSRWFQISKPVLTAGLIRGGRNEIFVWIFLNFVENWRFFWFSFGFIYFKGFKPSVTCLSRLEDSNDIPFIYFWTINYLIKCCFAKKYKNKHFPWRC